MSGEREPVYESDPGAAPDSEFEPGEVGQIVAGNRGRLLDPRRTPLVIVGAVPARAAFEVVVAGFEDAGARWELPLPEVDRMQFERGGARLGTRERDELRALAVTARRPLEVPAAAAARAQTLELVAAERERIRDGILAGRALEIDLDACVRERRGSDAAADVLRAVLRERDLAELERSFARAYVSNPLTGEIAKGHEIVLAELGLCRFRGTVVRDPELFSGARSRERRAAHIVLRLAFTAELLAHLGLGAVELHRGFRGRPPANLGLQAVGTPQGGAPEDASPAVPGGSLVAATFSREVALSNSEAAGSGLLLSQRIPVSRLLMTFIETEAMNAPYREAEALLIGDPENPLF